MPRNSSYGNGTPASAVAADQLPFAIGSLFIYYYYPLYMHESLY